MVLNGPLCLAAKSNRLASETGGDYSLDLLGLMLILSLSGRLVGAMGPGSSPG